MKLIILFFFLILGCQKEDRVKNFIQTSVLPDEMKMFELNSYKVIPLAGTCEGRKLYIIPAQDFVMSEDAGVGVNLCGSGGCVMYLIADDGEEQEVLYEANYLAFVKEAPSTQNCPDLTFESYMGQDGEETLSFNKKTGAYERRN